ncbi:MAG: VWA domain-containing protein [Ardenticatenaceae bacterium]|nr:VWA domain-containing protein [Ardenticatenaceae bacterium]
MSDINQPLYDLFTRLRLAELPLGVDDYALLRQALAAGRGQTRPKLAQLCRALWVRTADPALVRLFESYFERIIPQDYGRVVEVREEGRGARGEGAGEGDGRSTSTPSDVEKDTSTTTKKGEKTPTSKQGGAGAAGQQYEATRTLDEIGQMKMGLAGETAVGGTTAVDVTTVVDVTTHAYYSFSSDYLPVSRRQLKQNWRYLRRAARFGPPVELDVMATVNKIAHEGMLTDPVLRPRRVNRTDLILLLDQGGSMVPFHGLSARLVETAVRGGKLGQASVYYFHDCPIEYLYHDTAFLEAELITTRLQKLHPLLSSVLIFSDGGAARGRFEPQRVQAMTQFLLLLKQKVRHLAWLNPMPQVRWAGSSAEAVTAVVPMFEANPAGMNGAIKALRGQRPHALERVK